MFTKIELDNKKDIDNSSCEEFELSDSDKNTISIIDTNVTKIYKIIEN